MCLRNNEKASGPGEELGGFQESQLMSSSAGLLKGFAFYSGWKGKSCGEW